MNVSKIRKYDGQLVLAVGDLITHQQISPQRSAGCPLANPRHLVTYTQGILSTSLTTSLLVLGFPPG
jgi:hypothetical protein